MSDDSPLDESLRVVLRNAALIYAAQEVIERVRKQEPIPKYLSNALLKYNKDFWRDIDHRIIIPKWVDKLHREQGLPLSKKSTRGPGAFEVVAEMLGVSPSTVELAYYNNLPIREDQNQAKIVKARSKSCKKKS